MANIETKEVAVLLTGPFNEPFDYLIEDCVKGIYPGQIVLAPLGGRKVIGIIVGEGSKKIPKERLKIISKIFEINPIPKESIDLLYFLADWNFHGDLNKTKENQ